MEKLFENKFVRDEEYVKELYRKYFFCTPVVVICHVVWAFYFAWGIYGIIFDWVLYLTRLILPLIYLAYIILMYFIRVKIIAKRDKESYGGPLEIISVVTHEKIDCMNSAGTKYNLNYVDIKKVVKTKNYIHLVSKTNLVYSFKRDGFSVGNETYFLNFLKSKGIKVK